MCQKDVQIFAEFLYNGKLAKIVLAKSLKSSLIRSNFPILVTLVTGLI